MYLKPCSCNNVQGFFVYNAVLTKSSIMKNLNIQKTTKAILDKCDQSSDMSIDVNKFNEQIKQPNAKEFVLNVCILCEVEPVYD